MSIFGNKPDPDTQRDKEVSDRLIEDVDYRRGYDRGYYDGQIEALSRAASIADYHWRKRQAAEILRTIIAEIREQRNKNQ